MAAKITLVSHASVLIETKDAIIWTDPWITGRVFNDSWALWPEPRPDSVERAIATATHIWISHEHPDHFNIPTLRGLPESLKKRAVLLFQSFPTDRMAKAFAMFGFENAKYLRHRERLAIAPETEVYVYQVAPLDSCLGVTTAADGVILNVNDCELSGYDVRRMRKDLPPIDVLLNQYSFATYDGRLDHERVAPQEALRIREAMTGTHRGLSARVTIPFASLMYFCMEDNRYLNPFRNSLPAVREHFAKEGLELAVLAPGQTHTIGQPPANEEAIAHYRGLDAGDMEFHSSPEIPLAELRGAYAEFRSDLLGYYPRVLFRAVGPLTIRIPDIGKTVVMDLDREELALADGDDWDISVNSQPLRFVFGNRFGMQTLTISGRVTVRAKQKRFMLLRLVLALWNAEIYLDARVATRRSDLGFYSRNAVRLFFQFLSGLNLLRKFATSSS